MDKTLKSLELHVWNLGYQYSQNIEGVGYSKFIGAHPELVAGHRLNFLSHQQLRKSINLCIRLNKDNLNEDYQDFMRRGAAETKIVDRIDYSNAYDENNSDSDGELIPMERDSGPSRKDERHRARFVKRKVEADRQDKSKNKESPADATADQPKNWRSQDYPIPKCNGNHYIS